MLKSYDATAKVYRGTYRLRRWLVRSSSTFTDTVGHRNLDLPDCSADELDFDGVDFSGYPPNRYLHPVGALGSIRKEIRGLLQ